MRSTLTIVFVALLASAGLAQSASPPAGSTPQPKTGRGDFDEKPTGGGGLGGVRSKMNMKRLYVGGFPRASIPGARHAGPINRDRREVRATVPVVDNEPAIGGEPDILGVKPEIDLIHRAKFGADDVIPEADRSPLQVLAEPRRFDPSQLIDSRPDRCGPRGSAPMRRADHPVIVRTSEGMYSSDERSKLMPPRATSGPMVTPERAAVPEHASTELGDAKLVGTKPEAAISQLQAYLAAYPDDFHAMRMLGLALLANRNVSEAAAAMARAYEADPLLVKDAIVPSELGLDGGKVAAMVQAAQASASKTGVNAWLMALVLQQGQGQTSQALATLEKAKRAKLSPELANRFAASLATRSAERPSK